MSSEVGAETRHATAYASCWQSGPGRATDEAGNASVDHGGLEMRRAFQAVLLAMDGLSATPRSRITSRASQMLLAR